MVSLNIIINNYAKSCDFLYTRYADDLVFSTNQRNASKPFLMELREKIAGIRASKVGIERTKNAVYGPKLSPCRDRINHWTRWKPLNR